MANNDSSPNAQMNDSKWSATNAAPTDTTPRKRGFGAMDRTQVRELARKGGVAAHRAGTAHEFSSEEARVAGRKGGLATHSGRREQAAAAAANPEKVS
jgi:general stress protein YciG